MASAIIRALTTDAKWGVVTSTGGNSTYPNALTSTDGTSNTKFAVGAIASAQWQKLRIGFKWANAVVSTSDPTAVTIPYGSTIDSISIALTRNSSVRSYGGNLQYNISNNAVASSSTVSSLASAWSAAAGASKFGGNLTAAQIAAINDYDLNGYIYFHLWSNAAYGSNDYTTLGPVCPASSSADTGAIITVNYTPPTSLTMNGLMRYDASEGAWKKCKAYRYNGSAWVEVVPMRYNGTAWVKV